MNPAIESLGSIPGALLATALLFVAAWSVGDTLVSTVSNVPGRRWDRVLLAIAVGLNLTATLGVALGQLKLLPGSWSPWLLVGLSLLTIQRLATAWRARASSPGGSHPSWPLRFPLRWFAAMALALFTLGPALAFPTGWDELVYHTVLPRRWLADGWPAFYPDLPYSGFPSLGEILFWLVAPIDSVIAPRLIVWANWIVGLAILYRLLRRRVGKRAATVLTLAFALAPATLMISANCYVESILMMNLAALLLVIDEPWNRELGGTGLSKVAIVGVLAGGAAAVKLTGLVVIAIPCLWYAGQCRQGRVRWHSAARSLALCLTVVLFVALPFYLRPWLATGNPLYPYFCEWFSNDPARLEMSRFHHAIGGATFGVRSLPTLLTGPLLLAFRAENFDGSFGWQMLGLLALAAAAVASARRDRRRSIAVAWPGALWLGLYGFWFFTAQQARFAVPTILVLVLLAAEGLRPMRGRLRQLVLAALVGAAVVSFPWRTSGYYLDCWLTAAGVFSQTHEVDQGTHLSYLPLVNAIAQRTPENAKLLLLFEHRSLYVPRATTIGTPFFQERGFTLPERFTNPASVLELLAREGITHVVMTKGPTGPDRLAAWDERLDPLFRSFEQCSREGRMRVIWESEHYLLLEVR